MTDAEQGRAQVKEIDTEGVDATLPQALPAPQVIKYDPSQDRERARGWLAGSLIALLGGIAFGSFATLWWTSVKPADLKDLISLLMGPVGTLTGMAVGFYFGSKPPDQPPPSN